MHGAYDRKFRAAAWKVGKRLKLTHLLREGIYLSQLGPTYETPAELRMIRRMGGDVVGNVAPASFMAHSIFDAASDTAECIGARCDSKRDRRRITPDFLMFICQRHIRKCSRAS
jgi:hypothetical protein